MACAFVLLTFQALSQAPTLLWTNNVGATLFAVDSQTNLYANAGGSVIKLNPNGVPIQTNVICPLPGFAQRDAAGNFYFAGDLDGTQNFGGITVNGGYIQQFSQFQVYQPGYPTPYVAKYNAAGALLWVKSFGPQYVNFYLRVKDAVVDSSGAVYLAHIKNQSGTDLLISRIDNAGSNEWTQTISAGPTLGTQSSKFGGVTSSNCVFLGFKSLTPYTVLSRRISSGGVLSNVVSGVGLMGYAADYENQRPAIDNLGRVILAGHCNSDVVSGCTERYLTKYALDGSTAWSTVISNEEQWVMTRDAGENVYVGGSSGLFTKYDTNGNLLWSTNHSKKIIQMLVDASGNRFLSFADSSIARLASDATPQPPQIVTQPQIQTLRLGSNAIFSVDATGSPALIYQWRKNGTNLNAATSSNLTLTGITTNDVGNYSVVITNLYGSVTSAPAALLIAPSLLTPYSGTVGLWGQQATLSVSAWGSGTLNYQWYKAGQLISDATNSTLIFPSVQLTNAGLYSVVVSSQYGSVTNAAAELVVNPANISLGLYAGITIDGTVGYTYGIEYATNLVNPTWHALTNVTLTQPVEIWVDTSVKTSSLTSRYYRVTAQ